MNGDEWNEHECEEYAQLLLQAKIREPARFIDYAAKRPDKAVSMLEKVNMDDMAIEYLVEKAQELKEGEEEEENH